MIKASVQVQQLDILQGCSGWSVQADPETSEALCVKFGPYYQLQLDIPGSSEASMQEPIITEGRWQLTAQGTILKIRILAVL